jgi:hypothetical protein
MYRLLAVLLPLSLVACAASGEDDDSFDDALVQEYRTALPSAERLRSGIPTPESRAARWRSRRTRTSPGSPSRPRSRSTSRRR